MWVKCHFYIKNLNWLKMVLIFCSLALKLVSYLII